MEEAAEMLKAIAHPVRLCMVRRLWRGGECNVTCMQECMDMPQSTISQQLGKLRQAGIIEGERQGLEVRYSLKDDRVRKILEILFEKQECEGGNSK
ncbi:MAG: helix-turn-helix transcriptional regulator [Selenomonadaceae bacterium]|nr:helix-turn-helix transcriptional regulator [Selenomonadaceae bacterium]